jgi:Raf kinase inhibitor-like YbhB/YbcL family protein
MAEEDSRFQLTSAAFVEGGRIPDEYTCKGRNISPPLSWTDAPDGARSFALVVEDPDTPLGTMTHWVAFNIPAEKRSLPGGIPRDGRLPDGTVQGRSGMRRTGYMGPCPPWGQHRYVFTVYALDTVLEADPKMGKKKLMKAMEGHVLARATLTGVYSRRG